MTNPYIEKVLEQHGTGKKFILRTFDETVDEKDLIWHRDKKSRTIHILDGIGWKLQMEDKLPVELCVGQDHFIMKDSYHRIIKGERNLTIRIEE